MWKLCGKLANADTLIISSLNQSPPTPTSSTICRTLTTRRDIVVVSLQDVDKMWSSSGVASRVDTTSPAMQACLVAQVTCSWGSRMDLMARSYHNERNQSSFLYHTQVSILEKEADPSKKQYVDLLSGAKKT
jgi:hypothetical protein